MSEACAHDWVKKPDADDGEAQVYCSKCSVDRLECWCGATGTYDELFSSDDLSRSCHGTGVLYCSCGGDLCVCHNHGEAECFGCDACEDSDDDVDDWDGFYDNPVPKMETAVDMRHCPHGVLEGDFCEPCKLEGKAFFRHGKTAAKSAPNTGGKND